LPIEVVAHQGGLLPHARATTRDEFVQFNADEIKRWGQIVRGLGIQLNQ
jgi:hypothetical protein